MNPNRINYRNTDNLECLFLGELGWHTSAIAKETGLTESKVQYRLSQQGIKRKDYRNGKGAMAQKIMAMARGPVRRVIKSRLPANGQANGQAK